jgi:hypothetical protein
MALKFLKKKALDKKNLLMDRLHMNMHKSEPARSQKLLHASHLTNDFCPRQQYLIDLEGTKLPSRSVSVPLQYTFDEGNDKQARFNNDYMFDEHFGNWDCDRCGAEMTQVLGKDLPENSDLCLSHKWKYNEMVFFHKMTNLIGSVDSIMSLHPVDLMVMSELKTMKGDDFKSLVAPLSEHRLRTQLYLFLIAHAKYPVSKLIDTTKAHVVYMCRGFGYKHEDYGISPFKDFMVERDDAAVYPYLNKALALVIANKSKVAPARVCSNMSCTQAKNCPVRKSCFSQPDGGVTWVNGPLAIEPVTVANIEHEIKTG